jgi:hypothetical protein
MGRSSVVLVGAWLVGVVGVASCASASEKGDHAVPQSSDGADAAIDSPSHNDGAIDAEGNAPSDAADPSSALVLMWGDSIAVGQNDANNIGSVREFGVDVAYTPVTLASEQAWNANDPPPFGAELGPTALVAYNPGNQPGFGPEITFGRQLNAISPSFDYIVKCGISGSLLETQWLPTASYMIGTTGKNLYNTERDRARAYEASTGRKVGLIYINLGTNDASESGPAGRVSTNMNALVTRLRSDFPSAMIVWPLIHASTGQTFTSTVRTQQLSYASTAPSYFMLLNIDHLSLQDTLHIDTNSILTLGHIMALAGADLREIPRQGASGTSAIVGHGVAVGGNTATQTPLPWAGTQDNDTLLLFATGSGITPDGGASLSTISVSKGWTLVTTAQTTASSFTATWGVWKRKVAVGEVETDTITPSKDRRATAPIVTFANSTEHVSKVITVRGPAPGNQDVDVAASTAFNMFNQGSLTVPSITSNADNGLVIYFVGGEAFTTGDVATLTGASGMTGLIKRTETYHVMPDTGSNLLSIWEGTMPVHGSSRTASLSFSLNTLAFTSIVLMKP